MTRKDFLDGLTVRHCYRDMCQNPAFCRFCLECNEHHHCVSMPRELPPAIPPERESRKNKRRGSRRERGGLLGSEGEGREHD